MAEPLVPGVSDSDRDELDQRGIEEIRESLAEMRCGQVLDGKELHARLRQRHLGSTPIGD
jgi:hypothetical protein